MNNLQLKKEELKQQLNHLYVISFHAWFFRIFCGYWMYIYLKVLYKNIHEIDSSLVIIGCVFTSISLLIFFMTKVLLDDVKVGKARYKLQLNDLEKLSRKNYAT